MADNVKALLKNHPNLIIKENEDGKCKVVCQLTSHEMPFTMKAVEMYINGKKYKHACEHKLTSKEAELCSQYLTEKRGQLFCKLTKRYLNNLPHHIRRHINGRRFQKALNNLENTSIEEEPNHQEQMEEDTKLWIPPDSESESEEIEELDPEFKEQMEAEYTDDENPNYSFDVLNAEETPVHEDSKKEMSNRKDKAKKGKSKVKRSAAASAEKSKKKGKKSQKSTSEIPKKKRKKQDS